MKATRWIVIAAVVGAAIALASSCWVPPFDPELSTSVRFETRLEKVLSIGPIRYEGLKAKNSYFVPTYEAIPTDGYWVRREEGSRLVVHAVTAVGGTPRLGRGHSFENNNYGDLNAVQSMSPTTAAGGDSISPSLGRGIHVFGTGQTASSGPSLAIIGIGLNTWDEWNSELLSNTDEFNALDSSSLLAIGGSMQNLNAQLSSRNLLLAGDVNGSYVIVANGYIVQNHTFPYGTPILSYTRLNYPGPPLAQGVFFFTDSNYYRIVGTSRIDGAIVAYRWDSSHSEDPPAELSFGVQITDVLHDGTLLARGKYATGAYDVDGNRRYTLPTGSYRFIHEFNDGSTYYSYFARTVIVPDNKDDWKGQVYFDVVRCPTAELPSIGD